MLETQETTKMSRGKKLLFSLITIFILWLFFDTAAYILIQKLQNIYSIFYGFQPATDEYLEAYKKHFHPRWGWDIPKNRQGQLGNRKSREYEKKDEYTMKVFGDSFAYSTGDDNETFESMIEEKTGWECLNYGVGGYGTDQALLKYKDNTIKTKYTLLCIMDEDMGRCMNICRGLFYNIGEGLQPKPRFAISDVNSIRLINNPVENYNDLQKLKDAKFLHSLEDYDYWANYYKELNAPFALKWPVTLTILPHFDFFIRNSAQLINHNLFHTYESYIWRSRYYHLYNDDSEGIKIMSYIVDEFIKTANLRREIPIIVIFPTSTSVDILSEFGKKPYQSLVKYLESLQCHFIDFSDIFVQNKYMKYYLHKDDHFSMAGNKKVANEIVNFIQQLEH